MIDNSESVPVCPSCGNLEKLETPREVSKRTGIPVRTLERWRQVRNGSGPQFRLPYIKCGGRIRYRAREVDLFLQRNTVIPS
jgi:hypothetical protein